MVGSNNEYLVDLLMIFCIIPNITANMSGVVPSIAIYAVKESRKITKPKNAPPVTKSTVGVMMAAMPQPNLRMMNPPTNNITIVVAPVIVENIPINVL